MNRNICGDVACNAMCTQHEGHQEQHLGIEVIPPYHVVMWEREDPDILRICASSSFDRVLEMWVQMQTDRRKALGL